MSGEYKDKETLNRLYWDKGLSFAKIGDRFGVSGKTIHYWFDKYELPRRGIGGEYPYAPFRTQPSSTDSAGVEMWRTKHNGDDLRVRHHRLYAVAMYGFDEVVNGHIWFKNGLPWDVREDNMELLSPSEHSRRQLEERGNPMDNPDARRKVSLAKTGENNHNWRGGVRYNYRGDNWKEQRQKALERDNYECQSCGVNESEISHALHVHHIEKYEPEVEGTNRLENLTTLCPSCHAKEEFSNE